MILDPPSYPSRSLKRLRVFDVAYKNFIQILEIPHKTPPGFLSQIMGDLFFTPTIEATKKMDFGHCVTRGV